VKTRKWLLGSKIDSNREKKMNSNKIKFACITVFALAAANAFAQTTGAESSSSTNSTTSSTATSQGGGSSMNTLGSNASARGGNANLNSSGNSRVNVTVVAGNSTSPSTSGTGSGAVSNAQGDPNQPFTTQANENINNSGTQTVKTNPAIQAPGLTTTLSDTCMGSVSFGFSAPGFGATAGSTLVDQACVRRLDAREFRAMGLTDVALALLCQSDANRRAVEATGHLCPGTTKPLAKTDGSPSADATVADDVKYRDTIVRQRLGLPPLDQSAAVQTADAKQAQQPVAKQETQPVPAVVAAPVSTNAPLTKAEPAPEPVQALAVPADDIKAQELAPSPTKVADTEPAVAKGKPAVSTKDATQSIPVTPDQNAAPATQAVQQSTSTTSQDQDWDVYVPAVAKLDVR
jgi:hypothetical protein